MVQEHVSHTCKLFEFLLLSFIKEKKSGRHLVWVVMYSQNRLQPRSPHTSTQCSERPLQSCPSNEVCFAGGFPPCWIRVGGRRQDGIVEWESIPRQNGEVVPLCHALSESSTESLPEANLKEQCIHSGGGGAYKTGGGADWRGIWGQSIGNSPMVRLGESQIEIGIAGWKIEDGEWLPCHFEDCCGKTWEDASSKFRWAVGNHAEGFWKTI